MKPDPHQLSLLGELECPPAANPPEPAPLAKPAAPPSPPPPTEPADEPQGDAARPPAPAASPPTTVVSSPPGDEWEAPRRSTEEQAYEEEAEPTTSAELADWKDALRHEFERWLGRLDAIPTLAEDTGAAADAPDLYSFYEQWVAANAEARKANRRTAEAISQWGETLTRFEASLGPLRESAAQLAAAQPKEGQMSRAHCLVLVELLDRMQRIARAFQSPPARHSWWGGAEGAWRKAWETQRQALAILMTHLEELLKKEGVTRLDALGRPFDPAIMVAVAAEVDRSRAPQTVLEETAAGYLRHGELLRAAQVKVAREA